MSLETDGCPQQKEYDYLLKFLLVGDSDVGKKEMLDDLEHGSSESPYCSGSGNDLRRLTRRINNCVFARFIDRNETLLSLILLRISNTYRDICVIYYQNHTSRLFRSLFLNGK